MIVRLLPIAVEDADIDDVTDCVGCSREIVFVSDKELVAV